MYHTLSSLQDLPIPVLEVDGIPDGQEEPVVDDAIYQNILRIAASGECVVPNRQRATVYCQVEGKRVSRPILIWQTGEANRETDLGKFIEAELAREQVPVLTVEKVILRCAFVDKRQGEVQDALYEFKDWEGQFSYRLFSEPADEAERVLGLVAVHDGKPCLFPFGGPTEVGSQEAAGEIIPLQITPSRRGKLSFMLHARYCEERKAVNGYCYNGPETTDGWESDRQTSLFLASCSSFEPAKFGSMSGQFRLRRTPDAAIIDGFFSDSIHGDYGMLDRGVAHASIARLLRAMAGYTDDRNLSIAMLADKLFGDNDVMGIPVEDLRGLVSIFQEIVQTSRKQHEKLPLERYWAPAAARVLDDEYERLGAR